MFKPAMMARAGLDWDYRLLDAYHKANTSMVQLTALVASLGWHVCDKYLYVHCCRVSG